MANMNFKANLLPNTNNQYSLGSSDKKWQNIFATNLSGNAATATILENGRNIKIGNKSLNFDGSSDLTYKIKDMNVAASYDYKDSSESTSGYILILVPVTNLSMFSFLVQMRYLYYDLTLSFGGMNNAGSWAYTSAAFLGASSNYTENSIEVKFGKGYNDNSNQLWIAIPTSKWCGVSIQNLTNPYVTFDFEEAISIIRVDTLPENSTTQATKTIYRPYFQGGANIRVADGGTGASTFTSGALLQGNGTNAISAVSSAKGSTTLPIYIDSSGIPQTITSYAGNAATATQATQDGNGNIITSTYLPLIGGTMVNDENNNAQIVFSNYNDSILSLNGGSDDSKANIYLSYNTRTSTFNGAGIVYDMSNEQDGWAGTIGIKDSFSTTTALGWFGGANTTPNSSGLGFIYIGGSWSDPAFKMTKNGYATFKNKLQLPSTGLTNGTYDYTLPSATGTLALTNDITTAINALDGGTIGVPGVGKTITNLSQSDGNISATFGDISIAGSQITSGTINVDRLATSGVAAGSYGDSSNQTPSYNETFKVPYITVDNKGRVTAISEHTVTIPLSDNTDIKQNIVLATTGKAYLTGVTTTPTTTPQALTGVANTEVYLAGASGQINATSYRVAEHVTLEYDSNAETLNFVFT